MTVLRLYCDCIAADHTECETATLGPGICFASDDHDSMKARRKIICQSFFSVFSPNHATEMGYQTDKAGPKAPSRIILLPGFLHSGGATFALSYCRWVPQPCA